MQRISAVFLLAGCAGFMAAGQAYAEDFVSGFEDIPLMQGLADSGNVVSFDNPDGHFIQNRLTADDSIAKPDIEKFYSESLPHLGWTKAKASDCWQREDEQLCIVVTNTGSPLVITFELTPLSK